LGQGQVWGAKKGPEIEGWALPINALGMESWGLENRRLVCLYNIKLNKNIAAPKAPASRGLQTTLALGATALCAPNTQAAVVMTNVNFEGSAGKQVSFRYEILSGSILTDFNNGTSIASNVTTGKAGTDRRMQSTFGNMISGRVSLGSSVGPTNSWFSSLGVTPSNSGYWGVRVSRIGMGDSTSWHYGFAEISQTATGIKVGLVGFETTPNTAITVVPEPSSSMLLGLAGGAAALLGIRRRKAAAV